MTHEPGTTAVRYVGVDLAADPARTGLATIREEPDGGSVGIDDVTLGVGDEDLLAAVTAAEKTGVDVPFGWPQPFVEGW